MTVFHDAHFVEIDLLLRRGGHVNRSSLVLYEFLCRNFEEIRSLYQHYGCLLTQHPDGFYFLVVKGSLIRSKLLPKSCVHLGQFIALKARDPEISRSLGRIPVDHLIHDIETLVPRETLQSIYAPNRRDSTVDEHISDEIVRALKILTDLGFIERSDGAIRPLEAIHRFAELARYDNEPSDEAKLNLSMLRGIEFHDTEFTTEYDGRDDDSSQD